jgi:hypothetical protein
MHNRAELDAAQTARFMARSKLEAAVFGRFLMRVICD